jgi:hypothetical protein
MIRIALCDDEQKIHEQVLQYIDKYVKMQERNDLKIFCFNAVRDLNNEVDEDKSFDIFVLDVLSEMEREQLWRNQSVNVESKMECINANRIMFYEAHQTINM